VSFRFACELLQNDAGLVAESIVQLVRKNTTTKLAAPLAADASHQEALKNVIDHWATLARLVSASPARASASLPDFCATLSGIP